MKGNSTDVLFGYWYCDNSDDDGKKAAKKPGPKVAGGIAGSPFCR